MQLSFPSCRDMVEFGRSSIHELTVNWLWQARWEKKVEQALTSSTSCFVILDRLLLWRRIPFLCLFTVINQFFSHDLQDSLSMLWFLQLIDQNCQDNRLSYYDDYLFICFACRKLFRCQGSTPHHLSLSTPRPQELACIHKLVIKNRQNFHPKLS